MTSQAFPTSLYSMYSTVDSAPDCNGSEESTSAWTSQWWVQIEARPGGNYATEVVRRELELLSISGAKASFFSSFLLSILLTTIFTLSQYVPTFPSVYLQARHGLRDPGCRLRRKTPRVWQQSPVIQASRTNNFLLFPGVPNVGRETSEPPHLLLLLILTKQTSWCYREGNSQGLRAGISSCKWNTHHEANWSFKLTRSPGW